MRCPRCNAENQPTAKFCIECGTAFQTPCVRCGYQNPPTAKFCQECGASLKSLSPSQSEVKDAPASWSAPITAERPSLESHDIPEEERKNVTALFADLKDSTELVRDLDPEGARAIIDPALKIMIEAVRYYDGYVVQSTGDGIFALFGAPLAHEDHPQRALYAALRMQSGLRHYVERLTLENKPSIEARVGVHSGEVVMRTIETGGRLEYTPVGYVSNLAARLQTVAPAGGIAISEETSRLIEGYFELRTLGPTAIKGVAEPANVYQVMGPGPLRTHFQLSARRGLTKFIGREEELARLKRAFDLARSGRGQLAAIVAEAGTGKSRLVYEFKMTISAECKLLEAYSVSHGKASSWLPVLELLRDYFSLRDTDDASTRRERVRTRLTGLDATALDDTLPYLWNLLALQEQPDPLAQMDAQIKHQRTLDAIKRIILRESLNQPVVLIFEDLHWIDAETQALLDVLADSIANAPVLLLVNYRPEYRHQWGNKSYYSQLRLDALDRTSASEMLTILLGEASELDSLKRMIIERTEGNPFFIEEMLQALFDQGALVRNGVVKMTRPLAQVRLPPTVQGILAARIDRQPAEHKQLLQILAVLGREAGLGLLRKLVFVPEIQLRRMLADLQASEFIYEQPAFSDAEYAFKHALTQEVAYDSLLTDRRKLLHERAAAAIEAFYIGRLDDHLGKLGRHYQRSGNTGKAIEYLQRAGAQAVARSAHAEAVELFTTALELLKSMPEAPGHMQQELALQLALGRVFSAIKGYSARETGLAFERAYELCRQIGAAPHLFAVLIGLSIFYRIRAELQRAHELAQQALAIAKLEGDAVSLLEASEILGVVLFILGDLAGAQSHWERAIAIPQPSQLRPYHMAFDPRVVSFCWIALVTLYLGYPDQALVKSREAVASARKLSHPFTLVGILELVRVFHLFRGDGEEALALSDEVLCLAAEHGFQQYVVLALMGRGFALIEMNRAEEGIVQLRQGISAERDTGMYQYQTAYLAALGEGCGKAGRMAEGLAAVAEGLAAADRTGERLSAAELYRVKGDLLMQTIPAAPNAAAEAESCFRQAIEIAQHQKAKWWELRATMSLARLLAKQDRRTEARTMLAEIYGWFTEGFDTAALKEAKVLLEELAT